MGSKCNIMFIKTAFDPDCLPGMDEQPIYITALENQTVKDVPGGFPKSDLLGVTVALIHVAAQRFLAV